MPHFTTDNALFIGIGAIGLYFIGTTLIKYFARSEKIQTKKKQDDKPLPAPLEKQDMNLAQLKKYSLGVQKFRSDYLC